jgi:hypothetical protein
MEEGGGREPRGDAWRREGEGAAIEIYKPTVE